MSKQAKTYLSAFGILQIIVAIVLVVSFIPRETIPHLFNIGEKDKLVHLIMYGIFSLVIAAVLWQFPIKRWTLITVIACSGMGVIIEFLQPLLSNRSLDVHDMFFNTIGICVGVICAYAYKYRATIVQQLSFIFHKKSIKNLSI